MTAWPETLPDFALVEGYSERPPSTMLRTEMEAGPAKVRRRSTANARPMTLSVALTATQAEALDEFFTDTLSGGTLPFEWTHPRTQATVSFRFTAEPDYRPIGGLQWQATLPLEVLP